MANRTLLSPWQRVFTAVGLLAIGPVLGWSQDATGRIVGVVTDPSGAAVADAQVTATNAGTQISRTATSGPDGAYQILQLPIGTYRVAVERQGFSRTVTADNELRINSSLTLNVTLSVGTVAETIAVDAVASGVETVNATYGNSVTARPIIDLPLNGRNVLTLAQLQPGVANSENPGSTGQAGTFSIAGSRSDSVTFLLDGGLNNNLLSNGVVFNPNPDAIQEFRILTSNYTAEYGRNGGGVISVVTRSGTNELHGSLFEFLRNEKLNANNFFNNRNGTDRPVLKRNQFGGTVGGPVVIPRLFDGRNRLFFFTAYQGTRQRDVQIGNAQAIFTPAELRGDFSRSNGTRTGPNGDVAAFLREFPYFQPNAALAAQGVIDPSRIDPVAQRYIQAGLIPSSPTGELFPQGGRTDDRDETTNKVDYTPTEKDRFAVTLGYNKQDLLTPIGGNGITLTGFPIFTFRKQYFGTVNYTRIFTPSLLNEFRFTAQRFDQRQNVPARELPTPSDLGITINSDRPNGPPVLFFDSGAGLGNNPNGPTDLINNTYITSNNLTWTKGSHSLKGGFFLSAYQNNTIYDFYVNGAYSFGPSTEASTGYDFADFLVGLPYNYFQSPSAPSDVRSKQWAGFVQDEWRARRDLVLTFGLRYEYSQPKFDQQGRSFSLVPGQQSQRFVNAPRGLLYPGDAGAPKGVNFPDRNDVAPRFGFAYSPGGSARTSIRGGFGVFFDVLKGEDNLQFNGQAPFFGYGDLFPELPAVNPTRPLGILANPYAAVGAPNPFPSRPPAQNVDFVESGFSPLGGTSVYYVDPNLRTPYTYQYNLSVQHEVARNLVAQVAYVGSSSHKLTGLRDSNPILLGTTQRLFNTQLSRPEPSFSLLQEFRNVANASYNSLQTSLEKRFSNVPFFGETYFTTAYTWSHNIDDASGFRNRNSNVPYYNEKLFRADADFDVRHTFVFSGYWALPFDKLGGPRLLTGGWSLAPIFRYQTGFPLDVLAGLTSSRTRPGPSGAGDASLVRANLVGPGVTILDPKAQTAFNGRSGSYWFDPANFSRAGLITDSSIPAPSARTYGSLPRNAFRGPDFATLDVTFGKEFRFGERVRATLRGEFFNLLNRANFNAPNRTITSSQFGQITTTLDPRIGQLALRVAF